MSKPELQTPTQDEGKGLRQLMGELKAALDEHNRLMNMKLDHDSLVRAPKFLAYLVSLSRISPCFDDPRIAEQDRLNSLPESYDGE